MSQWQIRRGAWGLTAAVMLAAVLVASRWQGPGLAGKDGAKNGVKPRPAGQPVLMPVKQTSLLISLGAKDPKEAVTWQGELAVSEGKITSVAVAQGKGKAEGNQFTVSSQPGKTQQSGVQAKVRVKLDAPPTAKMTLTVGQQKVQVILGNLDLGVAKNFPKKEVTVVREDSAVKLTDPETEDDYPALARASDGKLWLAYNEFQKGAPLIPERVLAGNFDELVPTDIGDQVRLKSFDGTAWSPCLDVTEPGLNIWRPTVAVDKAGVVHVAWSQQVEGRFAIFHRSYTPAKDADKGTWSEIRQVSDTGGNDFHVVSAVDAAGKVWLAWQGWRDGYFRILVTQVQDGEWNKNQWVTPAINADSWSPAIAADGQGKVYVSYDTYEKGNFDVHLHVFSKVGEPKTIKVASSAKFEARPSLAADAQDRVWIAYEEGEEQWGKDYSNPAFRKIGLKSNPGAPLYRSRIVQVKCRSGISSWSRWKTSKRFARKSWTPGRRVCRVWRWTRPAASG